MSHCVHQHQSGYSASTYSCPADFPDVEELVISPGNYSLLDIAFQAANLVWKLVSFFKLLGEQPSR